MGIDSITIVGPTASGKTRRAVALSRYFGGEIISADSRQVYRDMTLGTGKDISEYGDVPYHLIDIREAGEKYNLHEYLRDFKKAYDDIVSRKKMPVICGGSGMYVENAIKGLVLPDVPENRELRHSLEGKTLQELTNLLATYKQLHNSTDVDTVKRAVRAIEIEEYYRLHPQEAELTKPEFAKALNTVVIGMDIPREKRRESISRRLRQRLDDGMVEEVKALLDRGIAPEDLIYYGLEYKFLTLYLIGELSKADMINQLEIAIHQFAKRQMTWFRGMEKRGSKIFWLPFDISDSEFINRVEDLISL